MDTYSLWRTPRLLPHSLNDSLTHPLTHSHSSHSSHNSHNSHNTLQNYATHTTHTILTSPAKAHTPSGELTPAHQLAHGLTHALTHSDTYSLAHRLTHPQTHSLTRSNFLFTKKLIEIMRISRLKMPIFKNMTSRIFRARLKIRNSLGKL